MSQSVPRRIDLDQPGIAEKRFRSLDPADPKGSQKPSPLKRNGAAKAYDARAKYGKFSLIFR